MLLVTSLARRRRSSPAVVTQGDAFDLVLTPPAVRAIRAYLPEAVVTAVLEFLMGALLVNRMCWASNWRGQPGRNPLGSAPSLIVFLGPHQRC